jgi:serine phosphatase RsbU (regulator of sigma subunit)
MKKLFILSCLGLLLICIVQVSYAQTAKIDSVLQRLQTMPSDSNRVNSYLYLATIYQASDVKKADEYLKNSIVLAKKLKYIHGEGVGIYRLGLLAWRQNNFPVADSLYKIALSIFEKEKATLDIADCLGSFGSIELGKGNYAEALNWYLKALKVVEPLQNEVRLAMLFNNIGLVYKNQNQLGEALNYFEKALKINERKQDAAQTTNLNNIGLIYYEQKLFEKAIACYQKALEINEKKNNLRSIALNTNNIANSLLGMKDATQALPYIQKSIAINQKLNQKNPFNYSSLAKAYNLLGREDSALFYFHYAIKISRLVNTKKLTQGIYRDLAENHKSNKKWDSALFYKEFETKLKDSLLSEESLSKVTSLQTNYALAQKQAKIALLEKDNEINKLFLNKQSILADKNATQLSLLRKEKELIGIALRQHKTEAENQQIRAENQKTQIALLTKNQELNQKEDEKQKLIQNISYLVVAFVLLGFLGLSVSYYQKQKANKLLVQQKQEIESQAYNLKEANHLIQMKNENIIASINYAKRIQKAMLPFQEKFDEVFGFNNSFILFMPRDIVSGDFYWLHKLENGQAILGVVDCTGHGVPGAFMSMIGNQLLFDIVEKQEIYDVAKILEFLHKDVQKTLKQNETHNHDGMDIALCLIDKEAKKVHFAGAMSPIYYVQNQDLVEIKADRRGIGGEHDILTNRTFTKKEFSIAQPTTIYLFTDGYKDQVGGSKKEKFMSKKFKEIILNNTNQEMDKQKELLELNFKNWQAEGERKQVDDVLVVGVRL